VMRRLPSDRRLSALIDDPEFDSCVRSVARTVAAFHESQGPIRTDPYMATRDAVAKNWEDNLADMEPYAGTLLDSEEYSRVSALARSYLVGNEALFQRRIDEGWVRDGHGDLLAEDIFCFEDGPRILDCLAFSDDLRISDVLADIGFLAMDLHRLAGPQAAEKLLAWYREFTNEHHPSSLAHHYVAYRAHVRAKIACLRHSQGDPNAADLAAAYQHLAAHHLERGQLRLILVGGGPGTGKSTLAENLSDALGCAVLGSDEIRKDLAHVAHSDHPVAAPQEGIYIGEMTTRVYDEIIRRAAALLERGESVALDATWTSAEHRELARRVATDHSASCFELECHIDRSLARERVTERLASTVDPSDATPEIVDHLASLRDPWPRALSVNCGVGADQALRDALSHVCSNCVELSSGPAALARHPIRDDNGSEQE
jgi:predicted kinase